MNYVCIFFFFFIFLSSTYLYMCNTVSAFSLYIHSVFVFSACILQSACISLSCLYRLRFLNIYSVYITVKPVVVIYDILYIYIQYSLSIFLSSVFFPACELYCHLYISNTNIYSDGIFCVACVFNIFSVNLPFHFLNKHFFHIFSKVEHDFFHLTLFYKQLQMIYIDYHPVTVQCAL